MGAGSKQARKYWLENLCREVRRRLDDRQTVDLPELRDGGITIGELAQRFGSRGVLVREIGDVHRAALTLEALGVVDVELTPAGYR